VDRLLLRTIRESPGLSLYELRKLLKWSNGKVDGSLRRLLHAKKIVITAIARNGRSVQLVYPKHKMSNNLIEIPASLITVGNPAWKDSAYFYALDNLSFGVTRKPFRDWENAAGFKAKVRPVSERNRLILIVPKKFEEFYHLSDKHLTKTVADNNVLVTITGTVIERKAYPSA
jgi:hypothetical protein